MSMIGVARRLAVGGLLAVAAMHANWARGSAWPAGDERALARAVIGRDVMPPAWASLVVAALLTTGAVLVAGRPHRWPRVQRLGAAMVATTLAVRALIGVAGLMPQERASVAFARWNRRLYSPLCLALAVLCAAGIAPNEDGGSWRGTRHGPGDEGEVGDAARPSARG